jgi:integrase/recombinase XerD
MPPRPAPPTPGIRTVGRSLSTSLKAGVDTSVIALWLGHEGTETTQIYLHADMTIKEQALARVQQPGTTPGRYRPPDNLLAFLDNL